MLIYFAASWPCVAVWTRPKWSVFITAERGGGGRVAASREMCSAQSSSQDISGHWWATAYIWCQNNPVRINRHEAPMYVARSSFLNYDLLPSFFNCLVGVGFQTPSWSVSCSILNMIQLLWFWLEGVWKVTPILINPKSTADPREWPPCPFACLLSADCSLSFAWDLISTLEVLLNCMVDIRLSTK